MSEVRRGILCKLFISLPEMQRSRLYSVIKIAGAHRVSGLIGGSLARRKKTRKHVMSRGFRGDLAAGLMGQLMIPGCSLTSEAFSGPEMPFPGGLQPEPIADTDQCPRGKRTPPERKKRKTSAPRVSRYTERTVELQLFFRGGFAAPSEAAHSFPP